jgi:phosphatidate cytidylyltransferase
MRDTLTAHRTERMDDAASSRRSNLALRLLTAGFFAPLIIYMLWWGPAWLFPAVTGVMALGGAWEMFTMVAPQQMLLRVFGTLASLATYCVIGFGLGGQHLALGMVALTCVGMLVSLAQPEPLEGAALRMGWAIAGPLYIGALFATLILLFRHAHGGSWVMLALLCGFLSDTAGYFVGRSLGRRKLAPVVSPKKTVEGSFGGLGGGLFGGLLAHFWFLRELGLVHAIALSLVAAGFGQAGDLCESLIKRSVGVKDSGTILPGHGGILDRSDAMLFSAAVIWAYVSLLA